MISTPNVTHAVVLAALLGAGACKNDQAEPAAAPEQDPGEVTQPEQASNEANAVEPDWHVTAVYVDVGVAELCGMDTSKTYFEYDSAKLSGEAKSEVAKLAKCFEQGALSGRDVVLIGRADPRGTDAYNRELGMSRAESVAQALEQEGLAESRITVESRGEKKAHENPAKWPEDRRVDVQLAD